MTVELAWRKRTASACPVSICPTYPEWRVHIWTTGVCPVAAQRATTQHASCRWNRTPERLVPMHGSGDEAHASLYEQPIHERSKNDFVRRGPAISTRIHRSCGAYIWKLGKGNH